jgi:aminoglycoside adenylyltransferase-like protein/nucleotidyltransferase-like protein
MSCMSTRTPQPTPYPEINDFLTLLLSHMHAVLGDQFIGLYLGGSLALGDFHPDRSDIDFVAVTVGEPSPETVAALAEMHARLWTTGGRWARKLDGSYVPQHVLRRWTSNAPPCPFIEEDQFYVTNQGSAVIQRLIIRQHGVVVAGPSPGLLIDPVTTEDLRNAFRDSLEKWWRPLLENPSWVEQSQKQSFAILTMCRTLYTLEHGSVASKPVAASWAIQTIGEPWTALIEWALARPHNRESDQSALTLRFIQSTLERYERSLSLF